jgi:hypothetical protein
MKKKYVRNSGVAGIAGAAIALAVTGTAVAAPPTVSLRVEGLKKTLLVSTSVRGKAGNFSRQGHAINYKTALGALQIATSGRWQGSWDSEYSEWELSGIFGESHPLTSKDFWAIYVNHRQASSGAGEVVLKPGQQIVFAVLPDSDYQEDLIGVTAPATATKGSTVRATVVYYDAKGHGHPLAGATVTLDGRTVKTGASGTATLTATSSGTQTITASKAKYVRDETTISVAS